MLTVTIVAEYLRCERVEVSYLLKKLGYRRSQYKNGMSDEIASKVIKAFRLSRATKPRMRKKINFKALKAQIENVVHSKPTFSAKKCHTNIVMPQNKK